LTSVRCRSCRSARSLRRSLETRDCSGCGRQIPTRVRLARCSDCSRSRSSSSAIQLCHDCGRQMPSIRAGLARCVPCRQIRRAVPLLHPLAYISSSRAWKPLDLGRMTVQCPSCGAVHWGAEVNNSRIQENFEVCCKNGSVHLEPLLASISGRPVR
jgi:hypothetical protein